MNSKGNMTAVEFLIDTWVKNGTLKGEDMFQATQMEKEQIMNAWLIDGYTDISNDYWKKEFEEYYNETFKNGSNETE